jgi:glyoxylase-like metal-dependent hydrolase (beta-lactamase superfamily II)/rhodanese-related sulfurtransferase
MDIQQIRSKDGTGTLSYLLTDSQAGTGVVIDPNIEDVEGITELIRRAGITLTHIVDTHTHVDHISAAGELRGRFRAEVVMHENTKNKWKVVDQGDRFGIGETLRANAKVPVDRYVRDGDTIVSGGMTLTLLHTPGHTDNHLTVLAGNNAFTGDLLLIGQAGRSDLPGGSGEEQYDSLFNKILPLPDSLKIYPGHDYADNEYSLLGEEKRSNPFLQHRSREEYVEFVRDFFPPIAEATAAGGKMTLQCGTQRVVQPGEGLRSITPAELASQLSGGLRPFILDVREPFELAAFGAIEGVVNIPMRQLGSRMADLPVDKNTPIVCVCQSGSRSLEATHYLLRQGYSNVLNLSGGTGTWRRAGFAVVRP